MSSPSFWLRCEKKRYERRTALTPVSAQTLIEAGFTVFVERDDQRIFNDAEYEAVGCKLVENNSWPTAPTSVPILGLKELPYSDEPIKHMHIHFGHCYKRQAGWSQFLARFHRGGGTLYDVEFLTDTSGRRVAAFGYHAGFAGAACGALALAAQQNGETLGALEPYSTEAGLVDEVKKKLGGQAKEVRAFVIGALGRCGRGAVDLFRQIGLQDENIVQWDIAETAKGGPFQELLGVDIFVNCIYLSSPIPPFLTFEHLQTAGKDRRLSAVVDVSCDTTNPHNPIPIYSINTTFSEPTVPVDVGTDNPPLKMVSIDQLPTLLPREASEQFSANLLPSLLQFPQRQTAHTWVEAEKLFKEKLAEAIGEESI